MVEIIPTIIAKTFSEIEEKIRMVEPFVKAVQLDIMDGIFVQNITWPYAGKEEGQEQKIRDLSNLETRLFLEAHLMTEKPERVAEKWLESKVRRVIIHYETMNTQDVIASPARAGRSNPVMQQPFLDGGNLRDRHASPPAGGLARDDDSYNEILNLIKKTHQANKEFGIALNPETPIEVLDDFISEIDLVLLMSVNPGFGGQKLEDTVFQKISALRKKYPDVKIEVDGGINLKNAAKLILAGADFLAIGSAIYESENISETIRELKSYEIRKHTNIQNNPHLISPLKRGRNREG